MKLLITLLIAFLFSSFLSAQTRKPTIKGHAIGEIFADFLHSEEKTEKDLASCRRSKFMNPADCVSLIGVDDGDEGDVRTSEATYSFRAQQIEAIELFITSDFESAASDTSKKFGKPTSGVTVPMQNGFGATWKERTLIWDLPGSYFVTLKEDNNPASEGNRPFLRVESRKEHVREAAERAASRRSNSLDR